MINPRKQGFNTALGARLRHRREVLGHTLTDVAYDAGIAKSHLSQVENGHVGLTLWSALRIGRVLGLTLDQMTHDLLPEGP